LQESDKNWHEVASASAVSYRNLAPGSYHFNVIATDTNGVWSDKVATAEFEILPAFYQTRWFLVVCIVAALTVLYLLYLLRLRQLAHEFRARMDERVDERTRIARELHDTLLQSLHGLMFQFQAARNMLPHRTDEAIQTLDVAISATEQAIAEWRGAIHDLRADTVCSGDLAESLRASAQELADSYEADSPKPAFQVIIEGEGKPLPPVVQDEVFRIAREILRNAFHHAHGNRIEAEIRYDEQALRVRIRDNGRGIDPKILNEGGSSGHWGLRGVRERAQQIGAQLDFWSEIGAGTEVQLSVPAAKAYEVSSEGPKRKRTRNRALPESRNHERRD
jgi:signal transduction histidine kinase